MPAQSPEIVIVIGSQAQGAVAGLNQTQKAIQGVQKTAGGATKTTSQFGTSLNLLMTPITNLGVGLRQMGQALQGVSFLATAFISIPITMMLKGAADAAIVFDAALVRAQKTTDLLDSQVGRLSGATGTLSGELRRMAQDVATPLETLGELAEQAGQLGVRGVDNILKFVRMAEIMGQTTDIAANEAIEAFGRLTDALGIGAEEAGSYMLQLASTVNMLENTTLGSAKNIADGMTNAISAAAGFNIAGADLAAFIATLYQVGIGSLEAGTMFSRMTTYVTTKIQDLADMTGLSVSQIRESFDKDFVGGLLGVLRAVREVESAGERMDIAYEIFGVRGMKGVALLSAQLEEKLIPNLEAAREEFQTGTSLIDEYVKAMSSTEAMIGVLQNNLKVLGVTLGDTFLPIINTLLKYVVPAVQMATEAFAGLDAPVRLAILAGAAFLAIMGPLTMILGTLAFSIGIAISAIGNFVVGIAAMGSSLLPLIGLVAGIGVALVGLAFIAEDAMKNVRDTFLSYAEAAQSWGSNLIGNFASGMLSGMAAVINAAITIANAIAQFFASFSPPKKGPLSEILNWGKNLIDTYIKGFKSADFSAIADVTSLIGGYFRNLGKLGMIDEKKVIPGILNIRHAFTELLSVFQATGEISQSVLDKISSGMGEMGDMVARYLELQLRVNAAQKVYDQEIDKLEQIRDLREGINKTYDRQVRAITKSGKPLLQQLSSIVQARYERDEQLVTLEDEETAQEGVVDAAEDQLDVLQGQLNTHEGLVDYYLDELDLLADQKALMDSQAGAAGAMAKALKAAAGAAGEFAGALSGIDLGGDLGDFEEFIRDWEELMKGIELSVATSAEGKKAIETFFWALGGGKIPEGYPLSAEDWFASKEVGDAYDFGRTLWGIFDEIKTGFDTFVLGIETGIETGMGRIKDALSGGEDGGGIGAIFDPIKEHIGDILGIAVAIALFALGIAGLIKIISNIGPIVAFVTTIGKISTGLAALGLNLGTVVGVALLAFVLLIAGIAIAAIAIGGLVTGIVENLDWFSRVFKELGDTLAAPELGEALVALGQAFADLWDVVAPILYLLWRGIVGIMTIIVKTITGAIATALPGLIMFVTGIVNILAGVIGFFSNALKMIWAIITGDIEGFRSSAAAVLSSTWTFMKGMFQLVAGGILTVFGAVLGWASAFIGSLANWLVPGSEDIFVGVVAAFAVGANKINEWMTKAKDWVVEKAIILWDVLGGVLKALGIDWSGLATEAETSSGHVGVSLSTLGTDAKTAETTAATALGGIGIGFGDLRTAASDASGDIQGDLGDIGAEAGGLESIFGGSLAGIMGTIASLESETAGATSDISKDLVVTGSDWEAYARISSGKTVESSTAITDMGTVLSTFGADAATLLTDLGLDWGTLDQDINTAQANTSGYIDTLGKDTGILRDDTDTASVDMITSWDDLDTAIGTVVDNIIGPGGFYELFTTATEDLETAVVTAFEAMELGVLDFETTVDRVLMEINWMIDNMLRKFRELQDEVVGGSIIPDMNSAIVQSFDDMISETSRAVGSWVGGMIGDFSALDGGAAADVALSAPEGTDTIMSSGPLVEIRQIVVPNMQVGQAFAKSMSEELSRLISYRRVPS